MSITDTSGQDRPLHVNAKRKHTSLIFVSCGLLLSLAVYAISSLGSAFTTDGALDRKTLRFSSLVRGDLVREIRAQGRVVVANSPTLFSPEAGYVELYVKAGDDVKQGQRLASISSPELGEQLARQKSELTRMQADLERQKIQSQQTQLQQQQARAMAEVQLKAMHREVRRAEQSFELKIISQQDYERVLDDLERAQLEFDQATQNLALSHESLAFYDRSLTLQSDSQALIIKALERRIDALQILSPVDGMVGNVQVNHKQAVAANQSLISVVDMSAYEVEASVAEGMAGELAPGMSVEIQLGGQYYDGLLTAISPEVINGTVIGRIRFSGDIPQQLRQNQRLTTRIKLENKQDTLMVERGPFFDSFYGHVFKVEEGRAHKVPVTLGSRSLQHIEILDGLDEDDTIIISALDIADSDTNLLISH